MKERMLKREIKLGETTRHTAGWYHASLQYLQTTRYKRVFLEDGVLQLTLLFDLLA